MNVFFDAAKKVQAYSKIIEQLGKGAMGVVGLNTPAKAHFAAFACHHLSRQGIYVTDSDYKAKKIFDMLSFYFPEQVLFYPSKELEFFKADAKAMNCRISALLQSNSY